MMPNEDRLLSETTPDGVKIEIREWSRRGLGYTAEFEIHDKNGFAAGFEACDDGCGTWPPTWKWGVSLKPHKRGMPGRAQRLIHHGWTGAVDGDASKYAKAGQYARRMWDDLLIDLREQDGSA